MPVIAKFYGIVIRMVFLRSFGARVHAIYEGSEIVVSLDPVRIIEGTAPERVARMVLEWVQQHQPELEQTWQRMSRLQRPLPIAPLV